MTRYEALAKWQTCCDAIELKGRMVRNGNWRPLVHALRHKDCEAADVSVIEQDGLTVLKIQPAEENPPAGKSAMNRPAFYLIVT